MPTTHPSKASVRRVRITLRLVPFVVLVLILGALGMGLLVGCGSDQMPSDEVMSVLEGRIAALNEGDGKAAAAFYAVNATMEELDQDPPLVTNGRNAIGDRLEELVDVWGLRMRVEGSAIQFDRYVTEPVSFYAADGSGTGAGMLVFEVNKDSEITHQWVIGRVGE
jgi:hypothetical protein